MLPTELIDIIKPIAESVGVPWDLAAAIVTAESAGNTYAMRFEPNWHYWCAPQKYAQSNGISYNTEKQLQCFSFGLMQVMGSVARELGFDGPLVQLCEPSLGITYGCKKIKSCIDKYPVLEEAVSSYNQGSPLRDRFGRLINYNYVDKVLGFRGELLGDNSNNGG